MTTTREYAREIEVGAQWKPVSEVYDYPEIELWIEGMLGSPPYTVNVGYADDQYHATVLAWNYTWSHGFDIQAEFELGPFHSAERAKRRAIVFVASLEALEAEAVAHMEALLGKEQQ